MNGEWLIRQRGLGERYETERVTIETNDGEENPRVMLGGTYMSFTYTDGRELIFPWNNILRCEYRPHTQP